MSVKVRKSVMMMRKRSVKVHTGSMKVVNRPSMSVKGG